LVKNNLLPTAVISLNVEDDVIKKRILGRRLDPKTGKIYNKNIKKPPTKEIEDRLEKRGDDTEEAIGKRLIAFKKKKLIQLNLNLKVF